MIVGFSRVASPFPFDLMPVDLSVSVKGEEYLLEGRNPEMRRVHCDSLTSSRVLFHFFSLRSNRFEGRSPDSRSQSEGKRLAGQFQHMG